ncbi:helix-turn-helix transcriptional regulator [Synechococcus sp. BDU 130192]|uniref:helix-turn-helix transcriptional regulator n=1 Tax=Synechococcus sp. BDU 130192 TaxID=2042059 RepID=UPI000C07847E|nr:WYL domain-containing protein [Synechococcus sp. BDU 130192]
MSRQLERLLEIDRLIRSRERQTQVSLAQTLEVSERTIRNDVNFLRDRYDAPLEYDRNQGWYYTDSNWRLPTIPVTQGELFALTLGARMLESYSGSIYQIQLRETIERIAERLPEQSVINLRQLAEERVHFRVGGEIQLNPEIWQALIEASERSQSVLMRYYSPQRQQISERIFDPYVLDIYRASNPYVWGYCHLREEVRQFRIDRIRKLEPTGQTFERREFDLQEKLKNSFQYEVGGKTYDVAIAFDAQTAPYITERQWHSTQRIETLADGSITLRFTASGLNDMKRWILGYGRGAIAKSPPELVKMLEQETAQMARQNETGEFE